MLFFKKRVHEEILKRINKKDRIKRYFFLIVGCLLLALSFNLFFNPNNLVIGGVSGLAIVVEEVFGISSVTFIIISYIILLIVSYFALDKATTKHSVIGSILYPLFLYFTQDICSYIQFDVSNMLLISIFGALFYGIGSGITFKYGFSTGGSDIIYQIISKKFKVSIGDCMRAMNIVIILGSGFFITGGSDIYAWETVMYAIITIYIISILNDKVLLGVSSSKSFYIITDHETSIKDFLMSELKMGVTVLEGRGGYTGDRKKVIMCVIPTSKYFFAKEGILEIDKEAIILINDVYQSTGIE